MIIIANFLSPRLNDLARQYCAALEAALGETVGFEPQAMLDDFHEGRVDIALICGLAYSLLHDADPGRFAPVAAPVVQDERGRGDAVYFSEIVVPASSPAASLRDLSGSRFAYNEAISFSGYRALEHELKTKGLSWDLFDDLIRTGSHRGSLDGVVGGRADAAAIDSHMLLLERQWDPGLAAAIRVIAALGPYPAPPLAVNRTGCDVSEEYLYKLLDQIPADRLNALGIHRWQPVDDGYYDAIRQAAADSPGLEI